MSGRSNKIHDLSDTIIAIIVITEVKPCSHCTRPFFNLLTGGF